MDLFQQRMYGNFGQPAKGECYNCWYGKMKGKYDQCQKCSPVEELEEVKTDNEQEQLKIEMGHLIKKMADNGLKPKLIFGKGDVKAQKQRYKTRVLEEKRFQCCKCQKVFTSNSSLMNHTANKVCEKKKNENRNEKHNCECGGKFTTRHKAKHLKTNKHLLYMTNK